MNLPLDKFIIEQCLISLTSKLIDRSLLSGSGSCTLSWTPAVLSNLYMKSLPAVGWLRFYTRYSTPKEILANTEIVKKTIVKSVW